jgi:peptidyl-prolyl cis-trans isomerase C
MRVIGIYFLVLFIGTGNNLLAAEAFSVGRQKVSVEQWEAKKKLEEQKIGRKLNESEEIFLRDSIINQLLMVEEARRLKIDREKEIVEKTEDFSRQLVVNVLLERKLASEITITADAVVEFYRSNPDFFEVAEISQILVAVENENEKKQAFEKASKLSRELSRNPNRFSVVAQKESDDTLSRDRGGELGIVRKGMLLPVLEEKVFKSKVNTVTKPVLSEYGYHIFYIKALRTQKFEEVENQIKQELTILKARELQAEYLEKLKSRYPVRIRGMK